MAGGGGMQATALAKQNEFLKSYISRLQKQLEVCPCMFMHAYMHVYISCICIALYLLCFYTLRACIHLLYMHRCIYLRTCLFHTIHP